MTVTGKHTQYAMETYFLVPAHRLSGILPEGIIPTSTFGLGKVAVGAWNHADAYVDDRSYGPVLEAWVAVIVEHHGVTHAYLHRAYNNSPSYSEPVNNIFKFNKLYADMQWRQQDGTHELEVRKDNRPVIRIDGRPTFAPKAVPFASPRLCWLIKGEERYVARMTISARRSRLAFCSVDIPEGSPLGGVAQVLKGAVRYSVFYEDASIEIPEPERYKKSQ